MKPLKEMNDIQKHKCGKCDYFNNKVPIEDKKPNCVGITNLDNCELYVVTEQLKDRIRYFKGELSPTIIHCKGKLEVDDYSFYIENDKPPTN